MNTLWPIVIQLGWLALESTLVATILLLLFRLRPWFGHSLLYLTLGSFQYLQTYLALSLSVEVVPGLVLNPGSAVLFTATLFTILLVYISEDLEEARRLIYGIVLANLFVTLVSSVFGAQVTSSGGDALIGGVIGVDIAHYATVLVVGTLILFGDVIITIMAYTWLRRRTRYRFLQVTAALSLALIVDSVLFVGFNFYNSTQFWNILSANILGKLVATVFCAALLTIYLRRHTDPAPVHEGFGSLATIFRMLTYNAPIDELKARLNIDGLTGVLNRSFFDRQLERETSAVGDTDKPVSLLMVDLDHFKQVNDTYGHQAGDNLLKLVGDALKDCTRTTDYVCRYGGEEFAVILPSAPREVAAGVAEKIRLQIEGIDTALAGMDKPMTTTIGLAECPGDATSAAQLIKVADRRLYDGKQRGRNTVVGS